MGSIPTGSLTGQTAGGTIDDETNKSKRRRRPNLWRFDYDGESVKLIATEEKAMEMVNELGTLRL